MDKQKLISILSCKLGASEFEKSLVEQYQRRNHLSEKQWYWVEKLAGEHEAAIAAEKPKAINLKGIFGLFELAGENLKFPKVYLDTESGAPVKIVRAGEKSRFAGDLMITDGRPFGDNTYYGRIAQDGEFFPGRKDAEVSALLSELNENAAETAKLFGMATGNCCFCRKELSDNRSIEAGYGKTCASNYGLPWGGKKNPGKKSPKKAGGNDTGKGVWNGKQYDYCTLSWNERGGVNLYGWGTYGRSSVLAGQSKKCFLEMYDSQEEAEAKHPDLGFSSKWTEPRNTFNHLPDHQDDGYFDHCGY